MLLKSISVTGLFGRRNNKQYKFNDDLSIITGRNGSGKTTIIKLTWFILSGNIKSALEEIDFQSVVVETNKYKCEIERKGRNSCRISLFSNSGEVLFQHDDEDDDEDDDDDEFGSGNNSAADRANAYLQKIGGSIFFPTFRRIEGGFSMRRRRLGAPPYRLRFAESEIDDTLSSLSRRLTNKKHVFVSAISTEDIVRLLLSRFSEISTEVNRRQEEISKTVINKIKDYERSGDKGDASALLAETRKDIEEIESFRSEKMKPFDTITKIVKKLFQHSGISFGSRINFGDAANAVNSDVLSAGEKQMLSFISYNAFTVNSIIFIDEPELSLHLDWQRKLYSILHKQNPTNQFIFSTHSPFIYGKYPDKEVALSSDRGEGDV